LIDHEDILTNDEHVLFLFPGTPTTKESHMSTFIVVHPIKGEPVELSNRLLHEHIKTDSLLWLNRLINNSVWSCPTVITGVHSKQRTFQVRSLYDFKELDVQFDFAIDESSCFSRQTMRLADNSDIIAYLERQQGYLHSVASYTSHAHDSEGKAAATFADGVVKLGFQAKETY
jgi:hypothetical protein